MTAEAARLPGLDPGDAAMLKVERVRQGRTERLRRTKAEALRLA